MKATFLITWLLIAAGNSAVARAGENFASLAKRCAPDVHPATLAALVRKESGFDPFVIGVNGNPHRQIRPQSLQDGATQAQALINQGQSIDIGLGQVNSRNLKKLGLSVQDAFDACRNLAASSRLLSTAYQQYRSAGLDEASALDAALSTYNTGDSGAGINNGYVGGVRSLANAGGYVVPGLGMTAVADATPQAPLAPAVLVPVGPSAAPATWDVFGDASGGAGDFVLSPTATPGQEEKGAQPPSPETGETGRVSHGMVSGGGTASQPTDGPVVLFSEPTTPVSRRPSPPS